jgi:hypothetical protein
MSDFFNLLLSGSLAERMAMDAANRAEERADALDEAVDAAAATTSGLQAQVKDQARSIQRLQIAVRILSELLIERGALDAGGIEARVNAVLASEKAARDEERRRRAAQEVQDKQRHVDEEARRAEAPIVCKSCSQTHPYRTMTLTEHGLICQDCRAKAEGASPD